MAVQICLARLRPVPCSIAAAYAFPQSSNRASVARPCRTARDPSQNTAHQLNALPCAGLVYLQDWVTASGSTGWCPQHERAALHERAAIISALTGASRLHLCWLLPHPLAKGHQRTLAAADLVSSTCDKCGWGLSTKQLKLVSCPDFLAVDVMPIPGGARCTVGLLPEFSPACQ